MSHNFEAQKSAPQAICAECNKQIKKDACIKCVNCGIYLHTKKCEEKWKKKKLDCPKANVKNNLQTPSNAMNSKMGSNVSAFANKSSSSSGSLNASTLSNDERNQYIKLISEERKVDISILGNDQVDILITQYLNQNKINETKKIKSTMSIPDMAAKKLTENDFSFKDLKDFEIEVRNASTQYIEKFIESKGVDAFFKMLSAIPILPIS